MVKFWDGAEGRLLGLLLKDWAYWALLYLGLYGAVAILAFGGFAMFDAGVLENPTDKGAKPRLPPNEKGRSFIYETALHVVPAHEHELITIQKNNKGNKKSLEALRKLMGSLISSRVRRSFAGACGCDENKPLSNCSMGWPERPCLAVVLNRQFKGPNLGYRFISLRCSGGCKDQRIAPFKVTPSFIDTQSGGWNHYYPWKNKAHCYRRPPPMAFLLQPSAPWDLNAFSTTQGFTCVLRGRKSHNEKWTTLGKEWNSVSYTTGLARLQVTKGGESYGAGSLPLLLLLLPPLLSLIHL